jgi:hypothetical protein
VKDQLIEGVYTAALILIVLAVMWAWAGASAEPGPARVYQCSTGNVETWVCD